VQRWFLLSSLIYAGVRWRQRSIIKETKSYGQRHSLQTALKAGGGAAVRPLPRDGGVEELHGDPTVGARPKA